MTIHIYSDSFGEEYSGGTWTAELGKLQNQIVVCNGKGGTGPNWSLRKLITHLEDSLPRPPLIHRAHGYFNLKTLLLCYYQIRKEWNFLG